MQKIENRVQSIYDNNLKHRLQSIVILESMINDFKLYYFRHYNMILVIIYLLVHSKSLTFF